MSVGCKNGLVNLGVKMKRLVKFVRHIVLQKLSKLEQV